MPLCRLHITGASGTGTTTLGRALANALSAPHADTDDYFWVPSTPPYTTKREPEERLELMHRMFVPRDRWVLSGSLMGWGDPLIPYFDTVVFLVLDAGERLARLHRRERLRYGSSIDAGGASHRAHQAFIEWAASYDDADFDGRSRVRHERWLAGLPCPVLWLDSSRPVPDLCDDVLRFVKALPSTDRAPAPRI